MDMHHQGNLSDLSSLNVLIIDDNLLVHEVLKENLLDMGIKTIRCAQNAYYGLRLCEQLNFDIVICAFNVESDKDGFHLLEELKIKGFVKKTTVLIFLSSETDEALVNSIIELQPDDFWVKPLVGGVVQQRLEQTLAIKKQLFPLYQAIEQRNFSTVIYYVDRHIQDNSLFKYHANLMRMKGEAYLELLEYKEAELFFKQLLSSYNFAWVYIGYVKSLIKQQNIESIHSLLQELIEKPETRFATHDLLAQYYVEEKKYDLAYEEIKLASKLAPRNIDRNKKLWDLARLNHDHEGQYQATKNIAINAKNSIHDSPVHWLNVIRAGIDLANSKTDGSSNLIVKQTERYLSKLESDYQDIGSLKDQLVVIKARLHKAKGEQSKAQNIVDSHLSLRPSPHIEANLDKVKVFHELGMREEAVGILDAIKNQISGVSLNSAVAHQYIEQETEERTSIHFTAKQLNLMAIDYFKKNKFKSALQSILQATTLAPKNDKLLLSLMKILVVMKKRNELEESHFSLGEEAILKLERVKFDDSKQETFSDLKRRWQA